MPNLAVNVAVIQEGKILLTKRADFETWILPSGGVEDGESLAQAAIGETMELRDQSGLARQEFYLQMLENAEMKETIEVE
ncbi:MAG TPA: NUDIX domain-containing protein [Anaerolineales bacterium]